MSNKNSEDDSNGQPNSSSPPWWHGQFDDGPPNSYDVGSASQEAVRLAAAVASWANDTGVSTILQGALEQTADGLKSAMRATTPSAGASKAKAPKATEPSDEDDEAASRTSASFSCENCPICQGMEMLQAVSPDAAAGLSDALEAVTLAVRQSVEILAQGEADHESRVEHIRID